MTEISIILIATKICACKTKLKNEQSTKKIVKLSFLMAVPHIKILNQ